MGSVDHGNKRDLLRHLTRLEERVRRIERDTSKASASISRGNIRIYGPDSPSTERILLSTETGLTVRDAAGEVTMIQQNVSDGSLLYPFQPAGEWAVADVNQWYTANPDRLNETTWNITGRLGSLKFHRFAPKFSAVVQFYNNTTFAWEVALTCDHNSNMSSILSVPSTVGFVGTYNLFELDIEENAALYEPIRVNLSIRRVSGVGTPPGSFYWEPSGVFQGGQMFSIVGW